MGIYYHPPQPPQGSNAATPPEPHAPIAAQGDPPPRYSTALMLTAVLAWPAIGEPRLPLAHNRPAQIAPLTLATGDTVRRAPVAARYSANVDAWTVTPPPVQRAVQSAAIIPVEQVFIPNARPPSLLWAAWIDPPRQPPTPIDIAPLTLIYGDAPPLVGTLPATENALLAGSWPADLEPRLAPPNNRRVAIAPLTFSYGDQPPRVLAQPLALRAWGDLAPLVPRLLAVPQVTVAQVPSVPLPRLIWTAWTDVAPFVRAPLPIAPLTLAYGDRPPPTLSRLLVWADPFPTQRLPQIAALVAPTFVPASVPPGVIWAAWTDAAPTVRPRLPIAPLTLTYGDRPPVTANRLNIGAWTDVFPTQRLPQSAAIIPSVQGFVPGVQPSILLWRAWTDPFVRPPAPVTVAPLTLVYGQRPPAIPLTRYATIASWPTDLRLDRVFHRPVAIAPLTLTYGDRPPVPPSRLPPLLASWIETPGAPPRQVFIGALLPPSLVPFTRLPRVLWTAWEADAPRPPALYGLAAWTLPVSGDIYRIPVEEYFAWQRPVTAFQTTPPASPSKGDRYIVSAIATAAWVGQENAVAWFNGIGWKFDVPGEGWAVFNIADSTLYFLIAGVWTPY